MAKGKRSYYLTPTARRHLREARVWSTSRWGKSLTQEYFTDLNNEAERLASTFRSHRSREELTGGTGLRLYAVREHYLVYEPISKNQIVVVAVLRQSMDIPDILSKGRHVIFDELKSLRESLGE